ncbi:MAG: S1C family serine protease [Deltaproteobacteria bacterium]|nr:S1C family serine protease [Deltaproteobacteria bacterium]
MPERASTRPHPLWLAAGTGLVGVSLGAVAVMMGLRAGERRVAKPAPPPVADPSRLASRAPVAVAAPPAAVATPSLVDAVARTRDAVVNLGTAKTLGSGVIVDPSGIVVTNYHVIADALERLPADLPTAPRTPTVTARFEDGRELDATILVADRAEDLAILRLKSPRDGERFAAVSLGRSTDLAVGQDVFAIGNPFGLNHSVSRGIVAAVDRTDVGSARSLPYVQLDASINVGNSGGPLFSVDGTLMGIVTLRRKDAEGIAFAVPVDHVRGFLTAVSNPDAPPSSGAIGVRIEEGRPSAEDPGQGYAAWLEVATVFEDGAAVAAGLREGDRIVEVRGKRLDGLPGAETKGALAAHLVSTVRSLFPGEHLPLTALRGGRPQTFDVEVGAAPSDQQRVIDTQELLGVVLEPDSKVPIIAEVLPQPGRKPDHWVVGLEIVQLLGKAIDSHEALGVQLAELRELSRRNPGPLRVGLKLRHPQSGLSGPYYVLVE